MTTRQIYEFINSSAPFETAPNLDNIGLPVGGSRQKIRKTGVVLESRRKPRFMPLKTRTI